MEIEAIKSSLIAADTQFIGAQAPNQVSFIDFVEAGVKSVNDDIVSATDLVDKFARGEGVQTDELMIALEQAQLSLKLAVEVKNKLTAAYQELFRMQV